MKKLKYVVAILLCATLLAGLILGYIFIPKRTCEQLSVEPHTDNESVVIGQAEVERILSSAGVEVLGVQQKDVDLGSISSILKGNPFVEKVNFVHFAGGKLVVDYKLRNIVLNVTTSDGGNYLVDDNGYVVPFSPKMTDYLMVVNGKVGGGKVGSKAPKSVQEALKIAKVINSDEYYKAQFRQIYINGSGGPELVSTIGGQTIILGSADGIEEKLDNLRTLYENGLQYKGYKTYSQLDTRFKNRIIATKHN